MNIFKRISATVSGTIEGAVSQLENHEAVVRQALKETRTAAARARVQLSRVQNNCQSLRNKLSDLQKAEQAWASRAVEMAASDEGKALECVRRRNQCATDQQSVRASLQEHERQEQQLAATCKGIEDRLRDIEHTSSLLRSRQSTAEAERCVARIESGGGFEIDDVIERWKTRIVAAEYESSSVSAFDSFEAGFREQEQDEELKNQLLDLIDSTGAADNQDNNEDTKQ